MKGYSGIRASNVRQPSGGGSLDYVRLNTNLQNASLMSQKTLRSEVAAPANCIS